MSEIPSGLVSFNLNHNVRVKLTDEGRAIVREQQIELQARVPSFALKPPVEDADGYSS